LLPLFPLIYAVRCKKAGILNLIEIVR